MEPFASPGAAPGRAARGQVTMETLLLAVVALSLLMIASLAVGRIEASQRVLADRNLLSDDADNLRAYADEICVLGAGNAREISLAPRPLSLTGDPADPRALMAARGGENATRRCLCPLEVEGGDYDGAKAYLWSDPGPGGEPKVRISRHPRT